jgi:hypothetical protein
MKLPALSWSANKNPRSSQGRKRYGCTHLSILMHRRNHRGAQPSFVFDLFDLQKKQIKNGWKELSPIEASTPSL